ncbi:LigA [Rhodotorula toruloides ATCC 204091]|uniref:BY PROTMAP: gi/342321501/gb/EGU13434.1/ LigA [Rhodotorula glutinis ATCC 204091] n=1 Tax=Rhodotorula toruloides TaxID=5286 RepID=A0A0K3CJ14_RHOTO|nr:LigA [Rhodotorula toruloides ATCC 204091]KAK4333211.1 LigA [Rhodotorula toruloides]PRQ73347.1 hypothetical protein AAT19DRAFT_16100 [Rhodotorula toruloides]
MSLASLVPDTRVDPALLPPLLPWSLRYNDLYPYCDFFSHIVPTQYDPPAWTTELEAYWQTFDVAVWSHLSKDHFRDHFAIMGMRERLSSSKGAQLARELPDSPSRVDFEDAIQFLLTRRSTRWNRLYGLDDIRRRYLNHPENRHIGVSDYDFLDSKLEKSAFPPPKAAPFSLWPIPLDPSLSFNPRREMLVCWGRDGVDWDQYALPDRPTSDSKAARRKFEPSAAEELEDADKKTGTGRFGATMGDATAPLLLSRSNGARSSAFLPAFTGLFHRRHVQAA